VDVVALACLVGLKASGLTWSAGGSRALSAALMVSFGCRRARSFRVAVVVARHDRYRDSIWSSDGEISVAASVSGHERVLRPSGAELGPARRVSVDGSGLALWQPMDGLTASR
jgi:hypothetical protein